MNSNVHEEFNVPCFYVNFYDGGMQGMAHNQHEKFLIFFQYLSHHLVL